MPNSAASPFRPPKENSRLFLLLFLAVLAAFGPFVTDLYLPTLPEQAREYAAAPATVQLGLSMTMWGLAIGQLFVGPLSDVRGRRGPLLASLLVFTGATFGAAVAPTVERLGAGKEKRGRKTKTGVPPEGMRHARGERTGQTRSHLGVGIFHASMSWQVAHWLVDGLCSRWQSKQFSVRPKW